MKLDFRIRRKLEQDVYDAVFRVDLVDIELQVGEPMELIPVIFRASNLWVVINFLLRILRMYIEDTAQNLSFIISIMINFHEIHLRPAVFLRRNFIFHIPFGLSPSATRAVLGGNYHFGPA